MAKLICDTNVFYYLGNGSISLADIRGPGDSLYYSPLAALEIAGKLSEETHEERQRAAKAILDSGAIELPDPDSFLTIAFGYQLAQAHMSVREGVVAMADSANMEELQAGVVDWQNWLVRRVDVGHAGDWRANVEEKWVSDLVQIMRECNSKFGKWYDLAPEKRKIKPVPKLERQEATDFIKFTKSHEWLTALYKACHDRAQANAAVNANMLANPGIGPNTPGANNHPDCYAGVYSQYLIRLLTQGALPRRNDCGDLELFIYAVDDDWVVLTGEEKLVQMCTDAGFGQRVRLSN
jgi:hypothetical protein